MPAATQAFFALDRLATEEILALAVKDMDDLTLKNAVYTLLSSYMPDLLEGLVKPPSSLSALAEAVFHVEAPPATQEPVATEAPKNELVQEEPEMRTASEENVARLMRKKRIDWEEAWTELRCLELEDGDSICCSEECEGNDSAIDELVWAAEAGKKKRNERRIAQGRPVSPDQTEEEDSAKAPYIAPPRVRDAEKFWPFMRCKNVARAIAKSQPYWGEKRNIPRSHHGLLEYIARATSLSVETLKKTHPVGLFKDNYTFMRALGNSYRW